MRARRVGEVGDAGRLSRTDADERARRGVQVDEEVAAVDAVGVEVAVAQRRDVEPFGLLVGPLDEEAVLAARRRGSRS